VTTTVLTLLSVPGILALTNLAKRFGVTGAWSSLVALATALALVLTQYALRRVDGGALWLQIEQAIIIALSAMGLWDLTNTTADGDYTPTRSAD